MNMVFTMGFRVQIFGRRCALEPAFFFIKRQYTEQLTDKQGEQFWAVSTCQKHQLIIITLFLLGLTFYVTRNTVELDDGIKMLKFYI